MSLKSQYSFAYGGTSVTIRFEAFRRNQTLEIRWSCQNPFERSQAGMGMDRSVHKATIEKKTVKLRADTHVTGRELRKFSIKRFQTLLPTDHSCTEQAALCVCVCVEVPRPPRSMGTTCTQGPSRSTVSRNKLQASRQFWFIRVVVVGKALDLFECDKDICLQY